MAVSSFQAATSGCDVTKDVKTMMALHPAACRSADAGLRLPRLALWATGGSRRLGSVGGGLERGCGSSTKLSSSHFLLGRCSVELSNRCPLQSPAFNRRRHQNGIVVVGGGGGGCHCSVDAWSSPQSRRARRLSTTTMIGHARAPSSTTSAAPPAPTVSLGLEVEEVEEPNSRVRLHITVPAAVCAEAYDRVLKDLNKGAKVPGFRKGHVPDALLVNFVGAKAVSASAVEAVLKRTLPEAMSSVAGRALKDSERIVTKGEDLHEAYDRLKPLTYEVVVDVLPKVGWILEDAYRFLAVEIEVDGPEAIQVSADAELRSRHKDLGTLRLAPERGLDVGDVAVLDISARRLGEDGTPGEKILSADKKGFQLDTTEAEVLPGFLDAVKGLKRGETRGFDLTFPDTWEPSVLRGVQAQFTADLKELFCRELPELNDEIAPKLVEGCSTIDEVRSALLKKYQGKADDAKKRAAQEAVAEELGRVAVVEIPHALLEEQGRQMYAAKLLEMQATGKLSKEQATQLSSQEMVQNFLVGQKAQISDAVRKALAVSEVFSREGLTVTEEELDAEVDEAVSEFKRYNQEYDEKRVREQAQEVLEGTKVLNWLVEHANIKYVERNIPQQ